MSIQNTLLSTTAANIIVGSGGLGTALVNNTLNDRRKISINYST